MAVISKFAHNFVKAAIEAGDTKPASIVEGLVRTFGLSESDANSLVKEAGGKVAEEIPAKPISKAAALKEQGAPKAKKAKAKKEEIVEGPIQGPSPLSTEDFEVSPDQKLDITKTRKDVSFPGTTTYPTTEGVLVGGAAGRTPRVDQGSELVPTRGGVPARTSQPMEAEYIPPTEGSSTTDLVVSKRPAQEGKQETGLVPAGQRRTTFITDEQGRTSAGAQPPEAQPRTLEERIARETEARAQAEAEQAIPESYKAKGLAIPLAGATTLAGALSADKREGEVPAGGETAKAGEVKRAPAPSAALPPKGGVGTGPTETKPVTGGKESQATPTQAIAGVAKLADKVQNSKSGTTSKPTLDELTGYLDTVAKDVNSDPRFNNTPVERDLLAARADAYRMYKEKADRNQLLGTVERAINAIAQFASAQAGFGTRQAGGNLPLSTADYAGQTEQAFREYQTDLGLLSDEQKAAERAKERGETAKEKEIARRQKTILERIETERNALKEAGAEKRALIAEGGREASLNAREARAIKRENEAIAKGDARELTKNISVLDSQLAALNSVISPVKKTDTIQGLNRYASAAGVDVATINNEIDAASGFSRAEGDILPGYTSKKESTKEFATAEIAKIQDRKKQLQDRLSQLTGGKVTTPAVTTPAEAPAGQSAASSGKVASREQVDAYASQYKMTPDAAAKYLQSQGYTIGR